MKKADHVDRPLLGVSEAMLSRNLDTRARLVETIVEASFVKYRLMFGIGAWAGIQFEDGEVAFRFPIYVGASESFQLNPDLAAFVGVNVIAVIFI